MDYKLCEGIQMSQTLKKYLIALTMVSAMAISSPTYAFCFFNCGGDNSEQIEENAERIEQVNKEDMRVKSGELNDGTLTLRVEDMEKTQGRDEIYGKDVDIDLSDLDQSEEVSENRTDINTNTTNISNNRTDIDQNTDRSVANENRSVDNSQRISNNRDDIAEHGDRLDQNDVKNQEQDVAIDENTTRSQANKDMNDRQNRVIVQNDRRSKNNETNIETNRQAIVDTNARIDGVMNDMKYLDRNLSAGVASAMAIGQHQFDPSYSGGQVSLSGGFYNGENAVSFAVGVPVGERAFFSAAIAADSGSNGESGSVGMTFKLP